MGAGEGGTSDGMGKSFRLGFGSWRGGKCGTSFGGGCGGREEMNFVGDGTTKVGKGFANIGWVVVCFIGVLRAEGWFRRWASYGWKKLKTYVTWRSF